MGPIFWATSTAIFAMLEIALPGLVTIWLALASLVLTFITMAYQNVMMEFFIFLILSLVFISYTRPFVQKYIKKDGKKFDSKSIGNKIKIKKVVSLDGEEKVYDVKFKGSMWTGISDESFEAGDIVIIKEFKGNKIVLARAINI